MTRRTLQSDRPPAGPEDAVRLEMWRRFYRARDACSFLPVPETCRRLVRCRATKPAGPSGRPSHAMRLGLRASAFSERDANSFYSVFKASQPCRSPTSARHQAHTLETSTPPAISVLNPLRNWKIVPSTCVVGRCASIAKRMSSMGKSSGTPPDSNLGHRQPGCRRIGPTSRHPNAADCLGRSQPLRSRSCHRLP